MKFAVPLLLLMATACSDQTPLPAPSPAQQPNAPAPTPQPPVVLSVRDVNIGDAVEGVYGDGRTINPGEHHFFVTVPRSGTLTATLTWDPLFLGTLLKLTLEGQAFVPVRPNWSPVVARTSVETGKRYLIVVSLYGADWLPEDRFQLTTRLEP